MRRGLQAISLVSIVLALAGGCGGGGATPSDAGAPDGPGLPDLSGVQPVFAPSARAIGEIVGLSYGVPTGSDAAAAAVRDFDLQAMHTAGLRSNRRDVTWSVVEPTRGQRDFSAYDLAVDASLAAGVATIPILAYGTTWATAGAAPGDTMPPDDPADYAAFAGAAATRWAGKVPAYEIWNEENLGFRFWQPREDAAGYARLLAAAATSIRAADPAARVVLGGLIDHANLATGAEEFLEDLYYLHPGLAASFDVLAFHPYMLYPPHVAPELDGAGDEVSVPRMVARLRAVMAFYGDGAKPMWATEVGWPTFTNGAISVDEEQQARWLVRGVLLLAGAGVDRVFWFTLHDGPAHGTFPPEDDFGLMAYDDPAGGFTPAPKRAWLAITTLLAQAGGLAVSEDVSAMVRAPGDDDLYAYRLGVAGGARRVTIVWRADDATPASRAVPVQPGKSVTILDMVGAPLATTAAAVPVSGAPVYVIEE